MSACLSEDYDGRYWNVKRSFPRLLAHRCSFFDCLWSVTIQRDVVGLWYARHQHSDFDHATRTGPSTVSSPRFTEWQLTARWAAERGLLSAAPNLASVSPPR